MLKSHNLSEANKRVKLSTRNKVRALLSSETKDAIKIINSMRKELSGYEYSLCEEIVNLYKHDSIVPSPFPSEPQTGENYTRLEHVTLKISIDIVTSKVLLNKEKIQSLIKRIKELNYSIVKKEFEKYEYLAMSIFQEYGYSHLLLRKCTLAREIFNEEAYQNNHEIILDTLSGGKNKTIVNSLSHCYQEATDYLNIKRSVHNIRDKCDWNKFTRDISRVPFHPHAINQDDLSDLIQSNLQSSLIDAIIILKVNSGLIAEYKKTALEDVMLTLEQASPTIEEISKHYMNYDYGEEMFFKHSSAWFENSSIVKYRFLNDHFYDDPQSKFIKLDEMKISTACSIVTTRRLDELSESKKLITIESNNLQQLIEKDTITRSSIFNLLISKSEGLLDVDEENLVKIMANTSDLSRTINVVYMDNFSQRLKTDISKLICLLLISRKSSNEKYDYKLRKLIQKITISDYDRDFIEFTKYISTISVHLAKFLYNICTEDFISKMATIIESSAQVNHTRAELHKWMWEVTGDSIYLDKARNLIIDHKINLVRGEIDDNRMYVDIVRFQEWCEIEILSELTSVLNLLNSNNKLDHTENFQLSNIIERCYFEFCTNNIFGISAYLGRRIRHGTFKGNLYTSVISIEKEAPYLDIPAIKEIWSQWKADYEEKIEEIIAEKIHIQSNNKKDGFLVPKINSEIKEEILKACISNVLVEFEKNKSTLSSIYLISEYCWRLVEVDLKKVNSFFKSAKAGLINSDLLQNLKKTGASISVFEVSDFSRDIHLRVSNKVDTVCGWFKRPLSVSPKVSLNLLYKAVVIEVNQYYPWFDPDTSFEESEDIELLGGTYHIFYDALFVVLHNAARHGKENGIVCRTFKIITNEDKKKTIEFSLTSEINDCDIEDYVNKRLESYNIDDVNNAMNYENRSGIPKLLHIARNNKSFIFHQPMCANRTVTVKFSYATEF